MCCSCKQVCTTSHVIFSLVYISIGTIQLVAGVFFFVSLSPLFRIGSNLWTGGWNVLFGVGGVVVSCVGTLSPGKQQILHYFTLSILFVNVINLVILEVGEFRLFLPESLRGEDLSHDIRFLLSCARMSSSVKTNSSLRPGSHPEPNTKLHPAHYTQSWVFDSSQNPADQPKTITLKRKRHSRAATDGAIKSPKPLVKSPNTLHPNSPLPSAATPVVIVEDAGNADRQLHFMTSFSRTPSPVAHSESGSDSELSSIQDFKDIRSQPVHDHLEKLTEPHIYRKRLDSARSNSSATNRPSPPRSVSPRVTSEQPQYASLVMELEKTFARKRSVTEQEAPELPLPGHQHRKSDAEFSKELEAALKSIESLESPQSIEIKSPPVSAKSPSSVLSPVVGPSAIQFETISSNVAPIPKDHDSVEVKPWNAKVPEPRGKPPPRSKSFVIRQDNGKTIINVKQTSSLESSPVPVHRSIVQIVQDKVPPSQSYSRAPLQSKNSFKCSAVNYSSLPLPISPKSLHSRREKTLEAHENLKRKRGNKTVGFRLENMSNNIRRAISFNESNSQESDLDKLDDSEVTGFRNRSSSVSPNQSTSTFSSQKQHQNLNRHCSNVMDYGNRYKTVDSSYGTLHQDSPSPVNSSIQFSSLDSTTLNDTIINGSYSTDYSKVNGVAKSNGIPKINGHNHNNVQSKSRKLNLSDTLSNKTMSPEESSELSDVESKDSEMLQVCFSEEESSANETSYVIENNKNQNLELPHNSNPSNDSNSVVPSNVEAGGTVECNNNLVQLSSTKQPVKLQSRWSIKSLLRRKPSHPITLPPELEAAFLKSESLIFLTEEELVARYESHKQTLRDIEQRTLQNMKASKKFQTPTSDSDC
ncbi:hypothetical protein M8J75_015502 [Diaphorina citri]|nr:hypothetical protein M8J75_015502 [Diaphorina citri]